MNNKKKVLITLGSFGVIATPIVSSVSFAEKEANKTIEEWKDFYNQVNDVQKDKKAVNNWLPKLEQQLAGSTFYKTHMINNNWNISSDKDIYSILHSLQQSNEFSDIEKVAIGKRIIGHQMATNVFKDFGFSGIASTNDISKVRDIKLTDPTKQGTNLEIDNQEIRLTGATGENTVFKELYKHLNEHEYDFSNQDILNYYIASMVQSDEFKDLVSTFSLTRAKFLYGNGGISFKDVLSSFYSYAYTFLDRISTNKLSIGDLLKNSVFSFLESFGVSSASNDEEAYEMYLNSPMAKRLYPNGEANKRLEEFKQENDKGLKAEYFLSELSRLSTMLNSLKDVTSPFLDKMLNNPFLKDKSQVVNASIKFAKALADYSNNFTSDVQLLVHNDPINGYSISIRTGHILGLWNDIAENQIDVPYFIVGNSDWDLSYGLKPFLKTYELPENANKPQKVVVDNYFQIPLVQGESVLNIEPGAVMTNDNYERFFLQTQIDFNDSRYSSNSLAFSRRPTSNDEAIKYENWVIGFKRPTWTTKINNLVSGAAVYFYKGDKGNPIKNIKMFPELTVTLNEAIDKATRKVFSQINEKTASFDFDPFASYSFEIKLLGLTFGKTYFNVYPDMHIENLRFGDVKANFAYKIMAERQ